MKKQIILTLALLVLATFGSVAQDISRGEVSARNANAMKRAHINPSAGQTWWGYFTDDGQYGDLGTEYADTYDCAIYIPEDHEIAKEAKIYAERLWLSRNANITNMKIWLSEELPVCADSADVCCKNVEFTKGGCVDYAFDEPYQMHGKGVYVGYSLTISKIETDDDKWPIYTTTGIDMVQNGLYVKLGKTWYTNFALTELLGGNWGNLAMQVLLGDGFYSNAASVSSVGSGVVVVGGQVNVPVTLENKGGNDITEFTFTVTNNGETSEPVTYDCSENPMLGIYSTGTYNVPLTGGSKTGEGKATVTITKVNGVDNEVADGTEKAEGDVITVAERVNKKTVMENFLNITDGFSPLVIISNDRLGRFWHTDISDTIKCDLNHDNYIGIMVHDRDAMQVDTYMNTLIELDELQARTQGAWIWADIDREKRVYQYYGSQYDDQYNRRTKFGIEDDFAASQAKVAEALVEITSDWSDKDSTMIRSVVNTTFQFDADKAHYALAFVLTEDGVHGDGDAWNLCNNVLPQTKAGQVFYWDPPVWNTYVCGETSIGDMVYNDVVVAGDEIYNGIDGSIKSPIVTGKKQGYIHKWDLSYMTNIQNKANLKIIAMLIDTKTGRIVNADRVNVGKATDGIKSLTTTLSEGEGATYNVAGQKVGEDYKGIIIKNGKKFLSK